MIFLTDSTDHISGKTGATLTVTASKNGGAFSSISPVVTERGAGWYSLALTTSHTDTLGDFAIHITATGADPVDTLSQIVGGELDTDISSVSIDVWAADITTMNTDGQVGDFLKNKTLTVNKYVGLQ